MTSTPSIHRRLTLQLLVTVLGLSAVAGTALYLYGRARLTAGFDAALIARGKIVAGIFQFDAKDGLEYNPSEAELAEFRGGRHPTWFQVWRDDGTVVARSPSLGAPPGTRDLPRLTASDGTAVARVARVTLPDGRAGRVACQRVRPRVEEDDGPVPPERVPVLTISVAQEPRDLDATLRVLATALLLAALLLAGGCALAVTLAVRRGLRPLDRLGAEAETIGAASLDHRFAVSDLPAELRPIAARLNGLLGRLGEAFSRERRFTADAAHELRTPIAELRALAEVALKWPEDDRPQQNYQDVLQIARQMEALITRLLSIARCEAGAQVIGRERLDVCRMLRESWHAHAQAAGARRVRVDWALPESVAVESDPAMLGALIDNLVSNAVTYAPADGAVRVEATTDGDGTTLLIRNSCDGLCAGDLPHLFEPFWRKDPSRTGGAHCGLGLSVVAAYAKVLGLTLRADLPEPGIFEIAVSFRTLRSVEGADGSAAPRPAPPVTSSA